MITLLKNSLKTNRFKFILISFQFMIAFVALLLSFSFINSSKAFEQRVEKIIDTSKEELYIDDFDQKQIDYKKIKEKINEIEKSGEKIGLEQSIVIDSGNKIFENPIMINEAMSSFLSERNAFFKKIESYKEKDNIIPAIVGKAYNGKVKEGDSFNVKYIDRNLKEKSVKIRVSVVLKNNLFVFKGKSFPITESINGNNRFIILPQFTEFDEEGLWKNIIVDKCKSKKIARMLSKTGNEFEAYPLKKQIEDKSRGNAPIVCALLIFTIIIIILSVLGCIGTFLSNITSRKKEFGIYYSLGLNMKDVCRLLLLEGISVFGVSIILSLCIVKVLLRFIVKNKDFYISVENIVLVCGLLLICAFVCEILPIKKLSKSEPVEMISEVGR